MQNPRSNPQRPHASRFVLALVASALLLVACGVREPHIAADPSAPPLRVATSGDYAPFSIWPEAKREPGGFGPDLIRRFAADKGRRIEWVRFRWPELVADAQSGAFDLALGGITVRPDRSIVGTFSVPVARTSAVVLVRSASLTLDALDTTERKIAVNQGGHLERVTRARFPNAEVLPTSPNEAVPGRLASGEVDAIVTDSRESPVWRRDQPDWLQIGPLTKDRKAVFAAPGREGLLVDFDEWLLGRHGRRILLRLQEKKLGIDPTDAHATVTAAVVAAIAERLALMPDVARYKRAHGLAIEVPDREQHVLDAAWRAVTDEAAKHGVDAPAEASVRAFYAAQIEAAKEIQRAVVAEEAPPDHGAPPDLDAELRPALIRIGDRMARLLVMLPYDPPHVLEVHEWDVLAGYGLAPETVATIRDALDALSPAEPRRSRGGSIF